MLTPAKVIAFDVDEASLISLQTALPGYTIEEIDGATAESLSRDWNPGIVDLLVVEARNGMTETLDLCRFLVTCGVLAREPQQATDTEDELPKRLGLHRRRRHRGRRPHSPLLVLVPSGRHGFVTDVLKTGAHSCLLLPINSKEVASMLVHAQAGNQPGRHTSDLEKAQTVDRWQDDGGQG